ncbi:MAG: hypothetical protein AABZ47_08950, partial [Planctomycetota bacterium]
VVIDCTIGFSIDVSAQTNRWGDLDDSGQVNLEDLIILLLGYAGDYPVVPLLAVDLLPCEGNGFIDLDDLLAILEAFAGEAYSVFCPVPCP